ncbi:hypothetical protein JYU29_00290 [Tianweitania sp. BSSL-BM11]|uniref:Uncharacterized protein n=1 Tax=Tianweitania aestuarii TaxID=2814886 RepID=A0ABS5RQR3_9HYPH|nr:hypothetical protein [Tianweitania aestuarii]MBS9719120.1 hypothetical protein [Tianweitania aestuarii]
MIEDCREIDATDRSLAVLAPRSTRGPAWNEAAPRGEVVAFRSRGPIDPASLRGADCSTPTTVDGEWRRRTDGLKQLGQRKTRVLRMMWPANDRGRKPTAEIKSTIPLHILTGAVAAFGAGLVLAGIGSLVTHPELAPALAGWLQ